MEAYPRFEISASEFGDLLARNTQNSLEIKNCQTITVHAMSEDGKEIETFNTDDNYGLLLTIYDIAEGSIGQVLQLYPGISEYGMDIYESKAHEKPYLQIDVKLDYEKMKMKITDVRCPGKEFWPQFGFGPVALANVRRIIID